MEESDVTILFCKPTYYRFKSPELLLLLQDGAIVPSQTDLKVMKKLAVRVSFRSLDTINPIQNILFPVKDITEDIPIPSGYVGLEVR